MCDISSNSAIVGEQHTAHTSDISVIMRNSRQARLSVGGFPRRGKSEGGLASNFHNPLVSPAPFLTFNVQTLIESLKKVRHMKTMTWKLFGSIAVAALMIVGCSAPVHVEKDDNVDFSKYKTFSWSDKEEGKNDRDKSNDLMEKKFKESVTKALEKQGWRVDNRRPDVLVSYDVLVERTTRRENDPVYSQPFTRTFYNPYSRRFYNIYYPSQFMGYDDYARPVREGTVTISVTDARTDKVVWQGWTTDEVNSRNLTSKEINNAVKSIFRKFDVAKR